GLLACILDRGHGTQVFVALIIRLSLCCRQGRLALAQADRPFALAPYLVETHHNLAFAMLFFGLFSNIQTTSRLVLQYAVSPMKGAPSMATHHFQPTHYHTAIGSHELALRIADGDSVITTTVDAMGKDASDTRVTAGGNPQTGPFYVEGAEPGDTLLLVLDRI